MTKFFRIALLCLVSTLPLMAAEVSGKWTYDETGGTQVWGKTAPDSAHKAETVVLNLSATEGVLSGTVTYPRTGARNVPNTKRIANGKIDGDTLSFDTFDIILGTRMATHYAGKIDGDTIHFTVKTGGGAGGGKAVDAHRSTE